MECFRLCGTCPLRKDPHADVRGIDCPWGCKRARTEFPPFHKGHRDVQPIRLLGDPVLRTPARAVNNLKDIPDVLVRHMFATMRMSGGIGLAAPQIGVSLRIAVIEVDGNAWTLINPEIASESAVATTAEEGCLSIPGHFGPVRRANVVAVKTMTNEEPFRASGLAARAVQHEIDHLNGVLFVDRLVGSLRMNPVPRATEPVYWGEGMECPGCGYVYDVPRTESDIEVLCGVALSGCQSPILHVKGAGSWWTKRQQQRRHSRWRQDQELRRQWLHQRLHSRASPNSACH